MKEKERVREYKSTNKKSKVATKENAPKYQKKRMQYKFGEEPTQEIPLPPVVENAKLLKYDFLKEELQFKFKSFFLKERVQDLNKIEYEILFPMELPLLEEVYPMAMKEQIHWIQKQDLKTKCIYHKILKDNYLKKFLLSIQATIPSEEETYRFKNFILPPKPNMSEMLGDSEESEDIEDLEEHEDTIFDDNDDSDDSRIIKMACSSLFKEKENAHKKNKQTNNYQILNDSSRNVSRTITLGSNDIHSLKYLGKNSVSATTTFPKEWQNESTNQNKALLSSYETSLKMKKQSSVLDRNNGKIVKINNQEKHHHHHQEEEEEKEKEKEKERSSERYLFEHPRNKSLKIKSVRPIIPYMSMWHKQFLRASIEMNEEYFQNEEYYPTKECDNKITGNLRGILRVIQKSRDKETLSLHTPCNSFEKDKFMECLQFTKNVEKKEPDKTVVEILDEDEKNDLDGVSSLLLEKYILSLNKSRTLEGKKWKCQEILKDKNTHIISVSVPHVDSYIYTEKEIPLFSNSYILNRSFLNVFLFNKIGVQEFTLSPFRTDSFKQQKTYLIKKHMNEHLLNEQIELYKYERDYKMPVLNLFETKIVHYILRISKKHGLIFLFPSKGKKAIFTMERANKNNDFFLRIKK